ncbi:MAG: S9 family peptidase [Lutibacter sp.]|uniref:S9 family peptidase n=1 Tax=Lutibacter sp. TaxID=1925666 RepID=UPI00299D6894|nr:S9 family peptidase [Lutibacter sp.]MDX1827924.1 S9 family peptidase [Lutibacter sp.]
MNIKPPKAKKIAKKLTEHGDERVDNYYWLNDRENPEVIAYLNAENEYYDAKTAKIKQLQEDLFQEMKSRIKEEDESVPYKKNQYLYITKFKTGQQYPIYTRKKDNLNAVEEIMFDVNQMAKKHAYFNLSGISVSPNNKIAAFGIDKVSRRQYTLYFKDLETNEILEDKILNTTGSATWANDNKTIFYTQKNPTTLRGEKIFKHILGTDSNEDVEIYFEKDEAFSTYVYKTKSEKYIIIGSYSTVSSEFRILEADNPTGEFRVFQTRERDLEYNIAHFNDHFYILTNKDDAINFKLMKTSEKNTNKKFWEEVLPHRKDVLLEDISIFKDFLVVEERSNGLNKIRIIRWDKSEDFYLPIEEETYSAGVYFNPEYDTNIIRYGYNSMTTPNSVIDFNVDNKTKTIKKEQQVLGGDFDKNNYKSKRIWAKAEDGTKIPISLVYHKNTKLSKKTPLLLYGYGSYGYTIDAGFSTTRLSLLNRGFVFAIAHVRGSEYLGRNWYDTGKLLHKTNTFTDFISCGKHLISEKYTSEKHLYASGGSAGGLLMGAIINMQPDLFNGVVASVPFVDVLTTMLDETIPLTTGEFDEWGNPKTKKYYDYIKTYSPIDNITAQNYPNMLVTAGLHDSQVQYFEPAKWVAKLRDYKTDKNILLLHTNMDAGHGGASGRFNALKETAIDYGFILGLEGYTSLKKNY